MENLPQEIVHATSPASFSAGVSAWCNGSSPYYGGPQLSRQNQKPHGKNKIPHGKTENLTAKPKTSRQKQKPQGKTKYLTAKTKYLTAKANTHGKTKAILFLL